MTIDSPEASPKALGTQRHHLAVVYVRQSTASQVERNTESTDRQYALAQRTAELGWPREAMRISDADLGRSGADSPRRPDQRLGLALVHTIRSPQKDPSLSTREDVTATGGR